MKINRSGHQVRDSYVLRLQRNVQKTKTGKPKCLQSMSSFTLKMYFLRDGLLIAATKPTRTPMNARLAQNKERLPEGTTPRLGVRRRGEAVWAASRPRLPGERGSARQIAQGQLSASVPRTQEALNSDTTFRRKHGDKKKWHRRNPASQTSRRGLDNGSRAAVIHPRDADPEVEQTPRRSRRRRARPTPGPRRAVSLGRAGRSL